MPLVRRSRAMIGVSVMTDIAFHAGRTGIVSAGDIAERLGLARRGMEPLLQALSRASLLDSVRGPKGGYRLGRPPRDIRLSDIVAVAITEDEEQPGVVAGRLQQLVIEPLWAELEETVRARLQAVSLDDLLRRAVAAGLRRPAAEPISFSI